MEQYRDVFLWQAEVRGVDRVLKARTLPGPLPVDRGVQPRPCAPEHLAVRVGLPLLLSGNQPETRLQQLLHVPGHYSEQTQRHRLR